jgi:hypothetical protein
MRMGEYALPVSAAVSVSPMALACVLRLPSVAVDYSLAGCGSLGLGAWGVTAEFSAIFIRHIDCLCVTFCRHLEGRPIAPWPRHVLGMAFTTTLNFSTGFGLGYWELVNHRIW